MKYRNMFFNLAVLFAMVLSACGQAATPEAMMSHDTATPEVMMAHDTATPDAMMMHDTPTPDAMMMHETPTPDAMAKPTDGAMMEAPKWFGASLTDVHSGNAFTINDFKGKVVLVETMAVWCSTCFQQQKQIKALNEALGMRDDFVSLSLDIDPNEDTSALTKYTQQNSSFDWRYAIAGTDNAREIGNTYGDQFLNPPSAPILIVDRHGVTHPLPFGIKSAEDLMKAIQPFLDEAM